MKTSDKFLTLPMLTLLVEGFLARTSALQAKVKVSKEQGVDYGAKCIELYAKCDPSTSSLKTAQLSLFEDSNEFYMTLPKSGMMRNGNVYRTRTLDSHTKEKESTLLPTPQVADKKQTFRSMETLVRRLESGHQIHVTDILLRKGFSKSEIVTCLEAMIGFPHGWTELHAAETL